ncbi:MAG: hypothetical protein J6A55_05125 [Oscillospiraceae bacterium]|nr:hypothetical protein [Oscillospiraceae bacterium]
MRKCACNKHLLCLSVCVYDFLSVNEFVTTGLLQLLNACVYLRKLGFQTVKSAKQGRATRLCYDRDDVVNLRLNALLLLP